MRRLIAAIRFLTILPIPGGDDSTTEELAGTAPMFPVVGLAIGGVAAGFAVVLSMLFPPLVTAVVLVLFLLAVSGGFHIDGLSDSADGLLSSRGKNRILEIMKDSHVGVMGVVAILCVVLLKVTAVTSLVAADVPKAVFLMPVAGRCVLVIGVNWLPSTRIDEGLGRLFCAKHSVLQTLWALSVVFTAAWFALQSAGLIATGAALVVVGAFLAYCYLKISGATGDTFGASCELAETAIVVALAAVPVQGLLGSG